MYKTIRQRVAEERQTALLWLFLAQRGLLPEFTAFYKAHHDDTMQTIEQLFRECNKQEQTKKLD